MFHAGIAQSGSVVASYCVRDPSNLDHDWYMSKVASLFDCPNTTLEYILECLRDVPYEEFVKKRSKVYDFSLGMHERGKVYSYNQDIIQDNDYISIFLSYYTQMQRFNMFKAINK